MLWKKIQHHQLIYSFVAFLFFSFLFSAGLSQDSYAVSLNCSISQSNISSYSSTYFDINFSACSGFSSNNFKYIQLNSFSFSSSIQPSWFFLYSSFSDQRFLLYGANINSSNYPYSEFNINQIFSIFQFRNSSVSFSDSKISFYAGSQPKITSYSIDFILYDSLPSGSCPEPEEPDCPDSETPYGDKLDDIKKAIYVCGAILIMLYFFFCIYKIIVKDGGSR